MTVRWTITLLLLGLTVKCFRTDQVFAIGVEKKVLVDSLINLMIVNTVYNLFEGGFDYQQPFIMKKKLKKIDRKTGFISMAVLRKFAGA